MSIAYILLNVDPGNENEVLQSLRAIDGVKEASRVYGMYDTIVKVQGDSQEAMKRAVMAIRSLQHIRSTLTLTVIE